MKAYRFWTKQGPPGSVTLSKLTRSRRPMPIDAGIHALDVESDGKFVRLLLSSDDIAELIENLGRYLNDV